MRYEPGNIRVDGGGLCASCYPFFHIAGLIAGSCSKTAEAEQLLSSVYNKFNEGFETSDLKTARVLIHVLRTSLARS
jgi:hypothetical protein